MGYTDIRGQAGKGSRIPGADPKAFWNNHGDINWRGKKKKAVVDSDPKGVVDSSVKQLNKTNKENNTMNGLQEIIAANKPKAVKASQASAQRQNQVRVKETAPVKRK